MSDKPTVIHDNSEGPKFIRPAFMDMDSCKPELNHLIQTEIEKVITDSLTKGYKAGFNSGIDAVIAVLDQSEALLLPKDGVIRVLTKLKMEIPD